MFVKAAKFHLYEFSSESTSSERRQESLDLIVISKKNENGFVLIEPEDRPQRKSCSHFPIARRMEFSQSEACVLLRTCERELKIQKYFEDSCPILGRGGFALPPEPVRKGEFQRFLEMSFLRNRTAAAAD